MENRRIKHPNVKASWIWEGDVRKLVSRKEEQSEERKGARKIEQKKVIMWSHKGQKTWNLQREHKKKKRRQRKETEKGYEKVLWREEKNKQSLLNCRTHLLCITDSKTRQKTHQNCQEIGVLCHKLKAKLNHKTPKKRNTNEKTQK